MSTEENKAIMRRMLDEVIVGGNLDLMDELVAPDFVNHNVVDTGEASSSVGIEAFRQELKALRAAFPDLKLPVITPACGRRQSHRSSAGPGHPSGTVWIYRGHRQKG